VIGGLSVAVLVPAGKNPIYHAKQPPQAPPAKPHRLVANPHSPRDERAFALKPEQRFADWNSERNVTSEFAGLSQLGRS
jgi:hypothetical protein